MPKIKNLTLVNRFSTVLTADESEANYPRQVLGACFSWVNPIHPIQPRLLAYSKDMLDALAIEDVDSKDFLNILSGKDLLPASKPYAMCYGGHQFGHWAGQLGDGRAINLAEVQGRNQIWALQLKGAGPTPYSRSADGMAVLRSSIREFLCSEAMYHLGVPTTRALSLCLSGDTVQRDMLYDGNPQDELGAIVCRVAPSFIRFGNFEILSARKDYINLQALLNFTIQAFYPELGEPCKETYLQFFKKVCLLTADMIVHWQRVGFVHGVMNTDNLSILGLTIDYGPYGWIENYDESWTPNTTDSQHKRYRFGNQASIALWNLTQLANALYPLIEDVPALESILDEYRTYYVKQYYLMLNAKLGLYTFNMQDEMQQKELLNLLAACEVDMTLFYRTLTKFDQNHPHNFLKYLPACAYVNDAVIKEYANRWNTWFEFYAIRLQDENKNDLERIEAMNLVNPKYVLRNYMAQMAIEAAEKGEYSLLHELQTLLQQPYAEQEAYEKWFAKRPSWALHKVGCSQLSCSS